MKNDRCISFPCLELPLRCYISNLNQDKRIGCNEQGHIFPTTDRQASEEWAILEDVGGKYALKNCAHKKFLRTQQNGHTHASDEDFPKWSIHNSGDCTFTLTETINDRCLVMGNDGYICVRRDPYTNQKWHIEFISGELCFMSSLSESSQMSCHPWTGNLSLSQNWKGWEVWRFIEAGDGRVRISNWTHRNKMLCCDTKGTVSTTDSHSNVHSDLVKWEVQCAPRDFDGVTIRSFHGKYLSVRSGQICIQDEFAGQNSTWQLGAGHRKRFFISSSSRDKRLGSNKDGDILSTDNRKDWEIWELIQSEDNDFALRSEKNKRYLGSRPNGDVYTAQHLTEWEKWVIERSDSGHIHISSKEHNQYLSIHDGRILTNPGSSDEKYVWVLEPKMPDTITGDQMRNRVIGGTAAAIAAPFAVVGAIGAIGFTSGGIIANSWAALMMSAEMVAGGGVMSSVGTVATLQSIGAAGGLGLGGTSAAMAAGASAGTFIGASIPGGDTGNYGPSAQDNSMEIANNRPFCEWRRWENH